MMKSLLPIPLNFATASNPDMTGIWLSKKTTEKRYLSSSPGVVATAIVSPPLPVSSDDGVVLVRFPRIRSIATSPFSAVHTLHPSRVSILDMSFRVRGSSSTTRTFIPLSNKMVACVVAVPPETTLPGDPADPDGDASAMGSSIENRRGFGN